ncbi:MAG TPA: hypothetical protein ENO01_01440 [Candidatus Marinimicrobia bacterium]|nr:hypothetical protein [Candidatus Neomarinimicrobiota bacterium]
MIDHECFTLEWIQTVRTKIGRADPTLIEKTIYAFSLLGALTQYELDFVFKGGTSLLLVVPNWSRFSTDIDIVTQASEDKLQLIFKDIKSLNQFIRWEENPRTPSGVPKKHYKFFYQSIVNHREDYILLDVLFEKYSSHNIIQTKMATYFLKTTRDIHVAIPDIHWLMGDKLTAFAPNTIGIPYKSGNALSILKQLFDLGELFRHIQHIKIINGSHQTFLKFQNKYRSTSFSQRDALEDTFNACFLVSQIGFKGSIENEETEILRDGIRKLDSHLINRRFSLNDAKIAASRIAFITAFLIHQKDNPNPEILLFNPQKAVELQKIQLSDRFVKLNRLKTILPEAFYYWHLVSQWEG